MDTRIGYPNEHLAGDSDSETTSPVFATAVGLVLNSLEINSKHPHKEEEPQEEQVAGGATPTAVPQEEEEEREEPTTVSQPRRTIFEKWFEKFKDFLDNAE